MGRDLAYMTFARTMASVCLAAAISVGICSSAAAAPADRAGDPVVLKGSDLPSLDGTATGKVVAFKWTGKWQQVPVQVDERHTVSVRDLYPAEMSSKYIFGDGTFDVEVYADAKTRSGADADVGLDADDEVVFMGGDTGSAAPAGTLAPDGVVAGSASKVDVSDTVGGGNGYMYLFRSSGNLDQSAGKDYVDYDFNLTAITGNETMLNDYGFSNSPNPEDSTVTTANYSLHSTDRWMEDEMKISAGDASNTDILDREAVSAGGLGGCGRSEYTFSGNWDLDTNPGNDRPDDDDEGTYIVAKDGPVRAIRSFMGANSGAYVQGEHKYYADHEDKTVFVRVHPIPDMYIWTDYSEAAIGMTYRDQLNEGGFPVDGNPDSITKPAADSILDGQYFWQQLSGDQGSVTTLVAAQASNTDRFNGEGDRLYDYVGYHLDDSTPVGGSEKQCGGDLKAYGASGVGIAGIFPNTDPILPLLDTRQLFVNRVRYFGAPDASAADADALRARTQTPLVSTATNSPMKAGKAAIKVSFPGKKAKAKKGKTYRLKINLKNRGTGDAKQVRVCVSGKGIVRKTCATYGTLANGKSKTVTAASKVKKNAKGGKLSLKVAVSYKTADTGVNSGTMLTIPFGR